MVRYEYETSPRKLEPEYLPTTKEKKAKSPNHTNKKKNLQKNKTAKKKELTKKKTKTVMYVAFLFVILITISYRNSLITENFNKIESLKKEYSTIKKENDQLTVSIENSLNLKNIEQAAKENGMQKLNAKQTVYVSLPKKDYVEPSSEKIKIEEEKNIIQKLLEVIKNLF